MDTQSGFETVIYQKKETTASITLNRPHVLNAYNTQMRDDLYQVLEAVRDDSEVQGVILMGAGSRAFCAGADLTEFGAAPSLVMARQVRWERDVWGLFLSLDKPLVAALHGFVLGSGVEMALLCDLRIATEDAIFGLPEVALGMIPAAGGTQTFPRILGIPAALELLLTSRRIDANEALRRGLVHRIVSQERLYLEAEALLLHILAAGQQTVRAIKMAIARGLELPLERALELEQRLARQVMRDWIEEAL